LNGGGEDVAAADGVAVGLDPATGRKVHPVAGSM